MSPEHTIHQRIALSPALSGRVDSDLIPPADAWLAATSATLESSEAPSARPSLLERRTHNPRTPEA